MTAAAGLLLALTCLAIVGAGLALAVTAWRPRPDSPAATIAVVAGLATGGACFLLAALHWLAHLLT